MIRIILVLGILILLIGCKSNNVNSVTDIIIKNDSINLYAFIGKKIKFSQTLPDEIKQWFEIDSITKDTIRYKTQNFDSKFEAKYKVVKNLFNDLKTDTIDFIVYDHFSLQRVDSSEYVILYIFLDKKSGIYYNYKYQFQPIEKANDGTYIGKNGESITELLNEKKNLISKAYIN